MLDILIVLARHKTLILRTTLIVALLGTTYALLAPKEFTSEAKMVQEAKGEGAKLSGGLGGLAGGLAGGAVSGLLGGGATGLGPKAYTEVLEGRTVRLAVVRDTFQFPGTYRPMTYVEYVNRPPGAMGMLLKYTLKLPWTIKDMVTGSSEMAPSRREEMQKGQSNLLSKQENKALESISGKISAMVGKETGLLKVSATASGPQLAAALTKSFIDHFTVRIREIRTKKVREKLAFVEKRFQEAEAELESAEDRLARFLERNQNPTTASLRFQRDRLQRQVRFKEQLYSSMQTQLTETRLDLQKQQPVVTMVEEPVPPTSRSAPKRTLIVLLSLILGGFLGVVGTFVAAFLDNAEKDPIQEEKLKKVRKELKLKK